MVAITNQQREIHQLIGLYMGPIIALIMMLSQPPEELSIQAWRVAAMGVLMAIWWATEAIPIAITALLPLVFFPLLGIASIQDTASPFANKVIYLFLGGFIVAFAMQRWNLHRRIALTILQYVGGNGRSLVGGFMLVSALLSMWVMNTSTTMMLLPIAISVITVVHSSVTHLNNQQRQDFQYALLLGVAYASSIGGMSTLVGTAPNAMLAAFMLETYDTDLSFSKWMLVGIPLSAVMAPLAWFSLTRWVFKVDFNTNDAGRLALKEMKDELGLITKPEIRVGLIFLFLAIAWISRPLLTNIPGLSALDDSSIAMAGAGFSMLSVESDIKNPALLNERKRSLHFALLLYPAKIEAGIISLSIPGVM